MITLADQTLWMLKMLVEAFVVWLFFAQGLSGRFFFFNAYFLFLVAIGVGRYAILARWGIASLEYAYFYFYTDSFLSIFLFLSIFEISSRLRGTRVLGKGNVLRSLCILLATAWLSFEITSVTRFRATHFVFEFSQNIYVVSCLAIAVLWIRKLLNDPQDRTAARFVNVLSVYFALFLLGYGVRQLAPNDVSLMNNLGPMTDAWLPLGCGFALVSKNGRQGIKR